MKIQLKHTRPNDLEAQTVERRRIACRVSSIIEGTDRDNGIPYKPNETDDSFWTVDAGNDWKIRFDDTAFSEPITFEVIMRYKNQAVLDGLTRWVAFNIMGELIP